MIYGIGVDLVSVPRLRRALERHGERFAGRILTGEELGEFRRSTRPAHFLAKRFAAKEALVKALGTGFRAGVRASDIGVAHDPQGRPFLTYSARVEAMLAERGIGESHLSLADEEDQAVAFVTLLRAAGGAGVPPPGPPP